MENMSAFDDSCPHVIIVGGGFGGTHAAHALHHAPVHVTVIDRTNHSVFHPLLYQVATAGLSSDEIAAPIRSLLRRQRNAEVLLAEVTGIDVVRHLVRIGTQELPYDYLVLATGSEYNYFGQEDWARYAPNLKTVSDARRIRSMIIQTFEQAEQETDPERIRALLTFVLVGGGPTGVEMAGALAELTRCAIAPEYRHIDTRTARIILFESGPRLLVVLERSELCPPVVQQSRRLRRPKIALQPDYCSWRRSVQAMHASPP
jgi:NADH dehydrogenase